jgi:hypothetical protein
MLRRASKKLGQLDLRAGSPHRLSFRKLMLITRKSLLPCKT